MATRDRSGGDSEAGRAGEAEPITLTDPDGAVTRMAPSSSWTREQIRAPGGEPALVTRLDSGQLWFAAGRRRSPWRHEIHVGAAVVTTPQGRFHATAEPDGGATVVCLAGRTRVLAGSRDPVVLAAEESAAISVDGTTVVVLDRTASPVGTAPEPEAPERARQPAPDRGPATADEARIDLIDLTDSSPLIATGTGTDTDTVDPSDADDGGEQTSGAANSVALMTLATPAPPPSHRWGWVAEVIAVAAVVALLVALAVAFSRTDPGDNVATSPTTTDVTDNRPSTTVRATTTAPVATTTTASPTTTAVPTVTSTPTTSAPPAATSGSSAAGQVVGCRRDGDGVRATVAVAHRAGNASRFKVTVGLVDGADTVVTRADARTDLLEPGGRTSVDVSVPSAGGVAGACELLGVVPA